MKTCKDCNAGIGTTIFTADMKGKIWTTILILGSLLAVSPEVAGQYPQVPVTISKEKVRMDGKVFYSHIVLERQTLYSISKAYGVDIKDIYEANPSLETEGLRKNAIILIPASKGVSMTEAPQTDSTDKAVKGTDRKKRDRKKKSDDNFVIHTVKWYEDLDVISEKYGVPVDIIMEVNGLTGRKLSNRQKLRIPADLKRYLAEHSAPSSGEKEATTEGGQEQAVTEQPADETAPVKKTVNAVLMLPFNAKDGQGSESNMDFYSGALLAARDLGIEGINVDLSVYDTGDGTLPITEERLRKSDVVIGPVSSADMGRLLDIAPAQTEIVSPIDPRTAVYVSSHSNFIQAPASNEEQYTDLAGWIKEDCGPDDRTVVIFEKGLREMPGNNDAASALNNAGVRFSSFSYSILEGRDVLESMETLMDSTSVNRVLVVSESEAFVNDVLRNLNLMIHDKYNIVLYGPSKIRGFETIDIEDLHNANLHVSLSYYVDYDDKKVQDFLLKYRALYNTEPGAFAFQGYDLMHYFISVCARYGSNWAEKIAGAEKERMLQTDFLFRKTGEGGLRNTGIRRVVYDPDYSVRLLD